NARVRHNEDQRFSLNMKSTFNLSNWLQATVGINGTYSDGQATDNVYNTLQVQERYTRIMDANGNPVVQLYVNLGSTIVGANAVNGAVGEQIAGNEAFRATGFHILDALGQGLTHGKTLSLRSFTNWKADLYKGLSYQVQFSYELNHAETKSYYDEQDYMMRMAHNGLLSYNSVSDRYVANLP